MASRVILIILDSVGIGALPDAAEYGDTGSDTLGNIIKKLGKLSIPNLIELGLGNINDVNIPYKSPEPKGTYGKAIERSAGKDTTTGHWEIAGLILDNPFPVYPMGFPSEVIKPFEAAIGRSVLFNAPASGSEIIHRLGDEHIDTGRPIVYTSADSVFQIAAHEDVIPLQTLYKYCEIARGILKGSHEVGRVIARPFAGVSGSFYRTKNRRDFSLLPPGPTILTHILKAGMEVVGVGKIEDIFAGQGLSRSLHTKSNEEGLVTTLSLMAEEFQGLIFTNLVDFDMLYGHRNDVAGYAAALEQVDLKIPSLLEALQPDDVLIITADHGCDPTTESTDHSREYIPVLITGAIIKRGVNLGVIDSFSDIGATILDLLGLVEDGLFNRGKSFKSRMIERV